MKLLILIAVLALSASAHAQMSPDRIEEKKGIAQDTSDDVQTEAKDASPKTKAQDYNSSRSNTTSAVETDVNDDDESDDDLDAAVKKKTPGAK